MSNKPTDEKIEPVLPNFGLAIGAEGLSLMLCKPKLLPIQSYSVMRMQILAKNQLNNRDNRNTNTNTNNNEKL